MTAHQFVAGLHLRHFAPDEILYLGQSNDWLGNNTLPPEDLWENIVRTAWVADLARTALGRPVWILSGYRSPAYNSSIGGASHSLHKRFNALDLRCASVTALYSVLRRFRDAGVFQGGLGRYPTFIHLDTRGENADW